MLDKLRMSSVPYYESLRRIGHREGKRPILVELCSRADKSDVMERVAQLKGSGIAVSDDLTPQEQCVRRQIIQEAKRGRENGLNCKVRRSGLMVNNRFIPVRDLVLNPRWMADFQPTRSPTANARSLPAAAPPPSQPQQQQQQALMSATPAPAEQRTGAAKRPAGEISVTPPRAGEEEGDGASGGDTTNGTVFRLPRRNSTSSVGSNGSSRGNHRGGRQSSRSSSRDNQSKKQRGGKTN
jgi:hypothetical protein